MSGAPDYRNIRTFEDAFQAGWDAPCEHGVPDPNDCAGCRLRPEEITALVALHRPYVQAYLQVVEAAAESAA